jgi:signal transduction histidine kinase
MKKNNCDVIQGLRGVAERLQLGKLLPYTHAAKLHCALGASVVLMLVLTAVAWAAYTQLQRNHEAVHATAEFVRELQQVRSLVDELDLLEHRYLLLADDRYRSRAESLREQLNNTMLQLEQSPQSIARQLRPFPRLNARSMAENVGFTRYLDLDATQGLVQPVAGMEVLATLRGRLAELHSAESLTLNQLTAQQYDSHRAWRTSFAAIAAAALTWALVMMVFFWNRASGNSTGEKYGAGGNDQPVAAPVQTGNHDIAYLVEIARDEERARIARDIHDELGALLMAIRIELKCSAKTSVPARRAVDRQWAVMLEHVDAAMNTVARIAEQLRPSIVDRVGLWPAVESLLREFEDTTKMQCRLILNMDIDSYLPQDEMAVEVFRIIQESLVNVARHAEASRVEVTVGLEAGAPKIEIADNGRGITPAQILSPHSVGIAGMFERAKLFGGVLQIQGNAEKGTRVTLRLPSSEVSDTLLEKSLDDTLARIGATA